MIEAIPGSHTQRQLLQHDTALLKAYGVELQFQTTIGLDIPFSALMEVFDAILLATGVQKSDQINISGEDLLYGVIPARKFLHAMAMGPRMHIGQDVVVLGGDRTAIYAARAALRTGVRTVRIIYAGTRQTMTAPADEIDAALREGVQLQELLIPRSFLGTEEATLQAIRCYKATIPVSTDGKACLPRRILGTQIIIPADTALVAVGEHADLSFLPPALLHDGLFSERTPHEMDHYHTRNSQAVYRWQSGLRDRQRTTGHEGGRRGSTYY